MSKIDDVHTVLQNVDDTLEDVHGGVQDIQANVAAIQLKAADLRVGVGHVQTGVQDVQAGQEDLQIGLKEVHADTQDVLERAQYIQSTVLDTGRNVEALRAVVQTVRMTQDHVQTDVRDVQAGMKGVQSHVQNLQVTVGEIHGDVGAISTEMATLHRRVITAAEKKTLNMLPRAKHAAYRPGASHGCLEGTRVGLLEEIDAWVARSDDAASRILWVHGMAGAGKTAIAHTVAQRAHEANKLGASFLFSRDGHEDQHNPSIVFPTIAHQLAQFSGDFAKEIVATLEESPDTPSSFLEDQYTELVVEPLSKTPCNNSRDVVLLVIDALDECSDDEAARILKTIIDNSTSFPFLFKVLITSRPEPHIASVMDEASNLTAIDLNALDSDAVLDDMKVYLRSSLRAVSSRFHMPVDWITDSEIDALARKAGKLFIFASASARFIGDRRVHDPRRNLLILLGLEHSTSAQPYLSLDRLYLRILQDAVSDADPDFIVDRFQMVMGGVLKSRVQLSPKILDGLLGVPRGITTSTFESLRSVSAVGSPRNANEDAPIELCHPSLADYLRDPRRCTDARFRIVDKDGDTLLARRCLELVLSRLASRSPDVEAMFEATVNAIFQSKCGDPGLDAMAYATRFWWDHLLGADPSEERFKTVYRTWCMQSMVYLALSDMCVLITTECLTVEVFSC